MISRWSAEKIADVIFQYGEERQSRKIARAIFERRRTNPVRSARDLAEICRRCVPTPPPWAQKKTIDPATRTFQALRIAVNDELGSLERFLKKCVDYLNPGGRVAIISFHSLEDRIVKNAMVNASKGCTCPPNFPVCVCGKKPQVKRVNRKPIISGEEELERNPRARSAKLRVCEKV